MAGVKPYYLHRFATSESHLCPSRALADWIKYSGIMQRGPDTPLFPRIMKNNRWAEDSQMVCRYTLRVSRLKHSRRHPNSF